jgi:intracellular septation protein
MNPRLKMVLDYGPLLLFFVAYMLFGIFTATGVIMAAITAAAAVEFTVQRTVSPVLLVTLVLVLVMGGLTLWLSNDIFLKMKPTILYVLFAGVLLGGLARGQLFIKTLLGSSLRFPDPAWRALTWRWSLFFVVLAIANEFVWRNFSTTIWVEFKVFGVTSLTLLFALAQTPFIMRHQLEEEPAPPGE